MPVEGADGVSGGAGIGVMTVEPGFREEADWGAVASCLNPRSDGSQGYSPRANFCSSLPPVRFLFNLLIVYQIFDRLSRI